MDFGQFGQFFEPSVDGLDSNLRVSSPNWKEEWIKGNVRVVDPDKIPKFLSVDSLVDYMVEYKYTVTSCPENQLDLSLQFFEGREVRLMADPCGLSPGSYSIDDFEFTFLPLGGGIRYIRLKRGRRSYFILDFKQFNADWTGLEHILCHMELPVGPYPSFGKIGRSLLLQYGGPWAFMGELPGDLEALAGQVFGLGRFESFWRGRAPDGVRLEDRVSAYPYELGNLQCPFYPYTRWVDISSIKDLGREIRSSRVCYAFVHLSEYSPDSFISTTRLRARGVGGVKQLFPGGGRFGNLTYGLEMLRLKLDEGHKFGQTLFPIAGYVGYKNVSFRPFKDLVEKLYYGKASQDSYTAWFYKMISVMLVGNLASASSVYVPKGPKLILPHELNSGFIPSSKLEELYVGRGVYNMVYAGHVVDAQIASVTRRAFGITSRPEGRILRMSIDGLMLAGGEAGESKVFLRQKPGDWLVKWRDLDPVVVFGDQFYSNSQYKKWIERYSERTGLLHISRKCYPDLISVYNTTYDDKLARRLRQEGPRTLEAAVKVGSCKRVWSGGAINLASEGGLENLPTPRDIPDLLMRPSLELEEL